MQKQFPKGLFRYAVQLEMVMRMIATLSDIREEEVEDMRREAINNVRRTRGKVNLTDIISGHYQRMNVNSLINFGCRWISKNRCGRLYC